MMATHKSKANSGSGQRFAMTPLAVAVVTAIYPTAPALAQDAVLEEITVTAQKREQNLHDVLM